MPKHSRVTNKENKIKALVNIEFVQGCHNKCVACSNMNKNILKFMTFNTLKKISTNIKDVFDDDLLIKVFGIGNSLLHPKFSLFTNYLSDLFPKSMIVLSSNYRDILKYNFVDKSNLGRIILTIQPYDLDIPLLDRTINHLKDIPIEQIRVVYLTPSFIGHEFIIKALVSFCDKSLDNHYLLVMRFLKHLFGYNNSYKPSAIPYFYEEQLQNNTEDKAKKIFGDKLFYLQTKGFKNGKTLNPVIPETEPSCAIDYMGNLHTCISRNSPIKYLTDYAKNYFNVVRYCCDDCPVMAEDFILQISKRSIEKVKFSCRCYACYGDDYIRCP